MATMPRGALAQEPEDQAEGPMHEQTEPPTEDAAEGEAPDGSGDSPGEQPAGGKAPDPAMQGLFETTLAHVMKALTANAQALDQGMQRDPVATAVNLGTAAVRSVVEGASKATGRQVPFEVILAVGVTLLKKLADIANQKGYLPDEQVSVFLKEAFQQSLNKWMGMDVRDGKATAGQIQQAQRKMSGAAGAMMQ